MKAYWHVTIQVLAFILSTKVSLQTEHSRESSKPSTSSLISYKDAAEHWIGYPKSPYTQNNSNKRPLSTTSTKAPSSSSPQSRTINYKVKKRKKKPEYEPYDLESEPNYPQQYADSGHDDPPRYMDYSDSDEDYQDTYYEPKRRSKSKFSMSASSPSEKYASSSDFLTRSQFASAFSPKIAQYVVHDPKKYFVQRIQPQAIFTVKPTTFDKDMSPSASSSTVRRLDPPDYDDRENFAGFGPQSSFPPRQVMDKIATPGDRQPCHGPECHQHHKGLVRFYWKRVIYPNDETGNRVRPFRQSNRNRRPRRRRRRRRNRDRLRSPSANKEFYTTDHEEYRAPEDEDDDQEDEDDDDDEDQEETGMNAKRHDLWLPGRAYGHDLDEGSNYSNNEKKVYRDKRYAYRKWQRQKSMQNSKY